MLAEHGVLLDVEDSPTLLVELFAGISVHRARVAYIEAEVRRNLAILEVVVDYRGAQHIHLLRHHVVVGHVVVVALDSDGYGVLARNQSVEHVACREVLYLLRLHAKVYLSLLLAVDAHLHLAFGVLDAHVLNGELHVLVVRRAHIVVRQRHVGNNEVNGVARSLVELHVVDGEPVLVLVTVRVEAEIDSLRLVELNHLERLLVFALLDGLLVDADIHIVGRVSGAPVYAQLLGVSVRTRIPVAQHVVACLHLYRVEHRPVVGVVLLIIIVRETAVARARHIHIRSLIDLPLAVVAVEVVELEVGCVVARLKAPRVRRRNGSAVAHRDSSSIVVGIDVVRLNGVCLEYVLVARLREVGLLAERVLHSLARRKRTVYLLLHNGTAVELISHLELIRRIESVVHNMNLHRLGVAEIVARNGAKHVVYLQVYHLVNLLHAELTHIEAPLVGRTRRVEANVEGHACCSVVEEILRCAHAEHLVVLRLQLRHCLNRGRIACVDGEFLAVRRAVRGVLHHQLACCRRRYSRRNEPVVSHIARRISVEHLRLRAFCIIYPCNAVVIGVDNRPFRKFVCSFKVGRIHILCACGCRNSERS